MRRSNGEYSLRFSPSQWTIQTLFGTTVGKLSIARTGWLAWSILRKHSGYIFSQRQSLTCLRIYSEPAVQIPWQRSSLQQRMHRISVFRFLFRAVFLESLLYLLVPQPVPLPAAHLQPPPAQATQERRQFCLPGLIWVLPRSCLC